MSDTQPPNDPTEPVQVTLDLPAGLARSSDGLVEPGIYPNRESALLHAIVESWRHTRGSYHTIRVDVDSTPDAVEPEPAGSVSPEA
jgi:hypothetical protein